MFKIMKWFEKSVVNVYKVLMLLIIALCICANDMFYYTKKSLPHSNLLYLSVGILLSLLLYFLINQFTQKDWFKKYNLRIMLWLNIVLAFGLIAVSYQYYFRTGWDAGVVIAEAGKIARLEYDNLWNWYFSRCSNNVFITVIFAVIIRLGSLMGIGNDYFYLVAFQCVGWAYAGYMIYLITDKLCGKKAGAVWSWILYLVIVGMSPWVVVPYTDTMALFVLTTIIYLLVYKKSPFLLGFLLISGYFVKPQILIIGIAGILLCGWEIWCKWRQSPKDSWKKIAQILFGMLLGVLIVNGGKNLAHIEVNSEKSLGIPHYLMLGLNERTNGVFADEDLIFSESFATKAERDAANLQVMEERIRSMGIKGFVLHLGKKLLTVYNDGTFAWAAEGGFFQELFYTGTPEVRDFLRQIYMPEGKYYNYFLSFMQTAWMGILFWTAFALMGIKRERVVVVLALAVIGFTLFELLVEPRARHTLIYIPIWIPFACLGIENVCKLFENFHHIKLSDKK